MFKKLITVIFAICIMFSSHSVISASTPQSATPINKFIRMPNGDDVITFTLPMKEKDKYLLIVSINNKERNTSSIMRFVINKKTNEKMELSKFEKDNKISLSESQKTKEIIDKRLSDILKEEKNKKDRENEKNLIAKEVLNPKKPVANTGNNPPTANVKNVLILSFLFVSMLLSISLFLVASRIKSNKFKI